MSLTREEFASLPPVLVFLVRECEGYTSRGSWGAFDTLGIRALQDLFFPENITHRRLYAFTAEPPHAARVVAVSVPLQLALEAAFFHVSRIEEVVLNPRSIGGDAAIPQSQLEFSVPSDFEETVAISHNELPDLIGAVLAQGASAKPERDLLGKAARALEEGGFFECYHLARTARLANPQDQAAWFYELFALSFFGDPNQALELYEHYPARGSADSQAQLLAARYRLLLKQFNEARTILHTLSFNAEVGALASCELARSFLIEKHYARALDAAHAAIQKAPALNEGYLLRGIALRGISYEAGDADGLRESYSDFERVAKRGGYAAAEALYHAGTVCARLGALVEAETAFRQSLFQRDRLSARDALIRMACAQEKRVEAASELRSLELLAPHYGRQLRGELGAAVVVESSESQSSKQNVTIAGATTEVRESAELWSAHIEDSVRAAHALLRAWEVPVRNSPADCILFDDLINRYAPDGDFPLEGGFSALGKAGHEMVARVLALHIGDLLVSGGVATWGESHREQCAVVSHRMGVAIPLEPFVKERVLLGASGDNFSSLESLVMELEVLTPGRFVAPALEWWYPASPERVRDFEGEVSWVSDVLQGEGLRMSGELSDLENLDQWIESAFEPGGTIRDGALQKIGGSLDRFIAALGLLVGQRIVGIAGAEWYDHEKSEGVSLVNEELGRVFPIARIQRRVYLASAADYSCKLTSLAWSVAVAAVSSEVRKGTLVGSEDVRRALVNLLPSIGSFPETELSGVVNSLLIVPR